MHSDAELTWDVAMRFGEELQHLSKLLKISAETILQIAGARHEDQAQLDSLALEVDVLADRLMRIGSRGGPSSPHPDGDPFPATSPS